MASRLRIVVCLMVAASACALAQDAGKLYKQARKAERDGDVVRAYLLYSQAATLDSGRPEYWARAQTLRTKAALKANVLPRVGPDLEKPSSEPAPQDGAPGVSTAISNDDLAEVKRFKPPPELKALLGRKTLDLRGDAKSLFEQVTKAYGLDTVFDIDYQPGPSVRLRVEDADYRQALHTVELATGSFVVPIGERLVFVAKDTQQKRAELEPTVAISVPIPYTMSPQEAQELARAVQQTMDIQKLAVDANRQMVLIRDRLSRVRPAQALFEQLAFGRPQLMIEMQFLEIDRNAFYSYGYLTPYDFPITYVGRELVRGATQSLAKFLFGRTLLGVGIASANLFANMTDSSSRVLLSSQMRASDGQPASFHVGDKFPIATAGFFGSALGGIPPSFNFEDLGLVLKVTPHVHGAEDVTLEVEAEFKVLAGQAINGIPIISTRKVQSKVRLANGQWAIIAGLMNETEARSVSGMAGLAHLPLIGRLLRQNDRTSTASEVVVLLKPTLTDVPAASAVSRAIDVGSDSRLRIPL